METLLIDPVLDRRPRVIRVLKLRERVGLSRLEAVYARALHGGNLRHWTLTQMLDQGLEAEAFPVPPAPVPGCPFIRTANELLGDPVGIAAWSSTNS